MKSQLIALAVLLSLIVGQGCPQSSSNVTSATPSDASGEPAPTDAGSVASACSANPNYNALFNFSFGPPQGYVGPVLSNNAVYGGLTVFQEAFVFAIPLASTRRIDIELFSTALPFDVWLSSLNTGRIFSSQAPVSSETFTTAGGNSAMLQVSYSSTGYLYEVFAQRGSVIYSVRTTVSLLERSLIDSQIQSSFRSLCVDPG